MLMGQEDCQCSEPHLKRYEQKMKAEMVSWRPGEETNTGTNLQAVLISAYADASAGDGVNVSSHRPEPLLLAFAEPQPPR